MSLGTTKLAIVGHAKDKFTSCTKQRTKHLIKQIISKEKPSVVISGGCPLGGVDIWAEETANELGIPTCIYRPKVHRWNPERGYGFRARNLDIANNCDVLYNVVVEDWPKGYTGKKYRDYHCVGKGVPSHVKSGGCWTAWKAYAAGKRVVWAIVANDEEVILWNAERKEQ